MIAKMSDAVFSAVIIVAVSLLSACSGEASLERQISEIAEPYHFSILDWQIEALTRQFDDALFANKNENGENTEIVKEYFRNRDQIDNLKQKLLMVDDGLTSDSSPEIEKKITVLSRRNENILPDAVSTLSAQIESVLIEVGIVNPWQNIHDNLAIFPPVNFVIQSPPHLLVVSPRDEITRVRDITLVQNINDEQKEAVEKEIAAIGMSGLVVRLGGIATYPAFVADTMSLAYSIEIAIEEWFHQYLFFRPLGFRYGMHVAGVIHDYEIATINEALAGMVSQEIAAMVYDKYYQEPLTARDNMTNLTNDVFDFYAEMRAIRLKVDAWLESGEIEKAERYMEERRLFLASHGYYIRKLNQAYFAFYGTYASSPGSVSPIGSGLEVLRQQSSSLKTFVDDISSMTDAGEIIAAID